jgi:S1-C subfamily serine protease
MKRIFVAGGALILLGVCLNELWHAARYTRLVAQEPRGTAPAAAATSSRNVTRLPSPRQAESDLTPEELVNIRVYENVNRSVVNIETKGRSETFLFFEVPSEGAGSGSVLDTSGHILTNYHVVEGARNIQVTLFNGKDYQGKLVGKDESNDVAVVKIEFARRSARVCHRQPFWLRADADDRHCFELESKSAGAQSPHHQVGDSNRRRHQSRKLRRATVG